MNLNNICIPNADAPDEALKDYSIKTDHVSVFLKNIKQELIKNIEQADIIFGCVAWLTDFDILDKLSEKKFVSIIVQKEDFLRPDFLVNKNTWKADLHNKYNKINNTHLIERHQLNNILGLMSVCCDPSINPIRCVGNHNKDKTPAFPRMHNKFIIFAKHTENKSEYYKIDPYSVWTGSFNFTKNAGYSLENALLINDKKIIEAYFNEYGQIAALSEELDWTSDWIEPQWRIGS